MVLSVWKVGFWLYQILVKSSGKRSGFDCINNLFRKLYSKVKSKTILTIIVF